MAAGDGVLAYAAGEVNAAVAPAVGAVSYTNSVGNAATTTLYGIDGGLDVLATQNPPNAGTLNTIGSIGVDLGTNGGFDISGATGRAYAAFAVGANTFTTVYSVRLSTGAATPIGATLAGTVFTDITVLERPGYVLAAADGGVFALGNTTFRGSAASVSMNGSVVGVARAAGDSGYWFASTDGGVFNYGTGATFFGSAGALPLNKPIVAIADSSRGNGYWLAASDGGVFNYGTGATFFGSAGALPLNAPVVGMTATPSGLGYWLVVSDGGIFAYGDARFAGSLGALRLNQPIVGMASTTTGRGCFLVAADGGVFAFGDAVFAFGDAVCSPAPWRPRRACRLPGWPARPSRAGTTSSPPTAG